MVYDWGEECDRARKGSPNGSFQYKTPMAVRERSISEETALRNTERLIAG